MTKTLTEQFRQGTLKSGYYYCKYKSQEHIMYFDGVEEFADKKVKVRFYPAGFTCVEPVPSYEKWKTQEDMLLIYKKENKRLKAVAEHCEKVAGQWADKLVDTERKVERLEKQLAIATKALKKMAKDSVQCAEQALEEIELRR